MDLANVRKVALIGVLSACGASGDAPNNVGFGGVSDIGQFRKVLNEGGLPEYGMLNANGFFNEHYVEHLPADCDGRNICVQHMLARSNDWVFYEPQTLLQIALTTDKQIEDFPETSRNITVAIDVSGSMDTDDRINYVKDGIMHLIDSLGDGDRLSIISYSDVVTVHNTLEEPTATDKSELRKIVDSLRARGNTNFDAGLRRALKMAQAAASSEAEDRVIFLSDGRPTVGENRPHRIVEKAEEYLNGDLILTTVGVGNNFNYQLMQDLAEAGHGNQYFLEDETAVTEVFTDELEFFMTPLAKNVTLEVSHPPHVSVTDHAGSDKWLAKSNGGRVPLDTVFFSSRRDADPDPGRRGGGSALFVELDGANPNDNSALVSIHLSYAWEEGLETRTQLVAYPPEDETQPYFSDDAMSKHYAVYNLYQGLQRANYYADRKGDAQCAVAVLARVRNRARHWNEPRQDADIAADIKLIDDFLFNLRGSADSEWRGGCDDELPEPQLATEYPRADVGGCTSASPVGLPLLALLAGLLLSLGRRSLRLWRK